MRCFYRYNNATQKQIAMPDSRYFIMCEPRVKKVYLLNFTIR
jgi:hypothetical protein